MALRESMDQNESTSNTNREFWDSKASAYNSSHDQLAQTITALITDNAAWIGIPTNGKALDFACGTGLVSRAIASTAPGLSLRGMDISHQMVARYKESLQEAGIQDAFAVEVDLMDNSAFSPSSPIAGPDWLDFDIAAVANSLHHIDKSDLAVARLVERLKPGGMLCVIDWLDPGDGHKDHHRHHTHKAQHVLKDKPDEEHLLKKYGVAHSHGFSQDRIEKLMSGAGLEDVGFRSLEKPLQFGAFERRVFVARGRKAKPFKLGVSQATANIIMH